MKYRLLILTFFITFSLIIQPMAPVVVALARPAITALACAAMNAIPALPAVLASVVHYFSSAESHAQDSKLFQALAVQAQEYSLIIPPVEMINWLQSKNIEFKVI